MPDYNLFDVCRWVGCVCEHYFPHQTQFLAYFLVHTKVFFFTYSSLTYILQYCIDVIDIIIIDILSSYFTCEENMKQACEPELSGD